jgi:hypothetical protein
MTASGNGSFNITYVSSENALPQPAPGGTSIVR